VAGVRSSDRRDLLIGFTSLLAIMSAHALGETARDGLFLAGLRAQMLPWAYLTIAGLALIVVRANAWVLQHSRDKRKLLAKTMLGAAIIDFGLSWWLGQGDQAQGRAFLLYVWTGLFATVTVVQFWLLIDDVVDVGKAKRIFGPVAAGGVLGATLGSLLAERLVDAGLPPYTLIAAAGAALLFGAMVPLAWGVPEAHEEASGTKPTSLVKDLVTLCAHFYLRRLLLIVMVSTLALTGVDFVFKSMVDAAYAGQPNGAAAMSQFFARFYFAINLVALFGQVVISPWVFSKFGVNRALLLMPVLLLLGTVGVIVLPVLWMAVVLKGVDGSLRHSLQRTGMEVLYLPVPRRLRERFKGLIDGVGQRGGQALASVIILGALAMSGDIRTVAAGILVFVLVWVAVLVSIHRPYLELFRRTLQSGVEPGVGVGLIPLDLRALESLVASLNSERDEEVLVTLELFERYDRVALIPQLVLYHPSPEVVARAFSLFDTTPDINILPIAHRLLGSQSDTIRSIALHAIHQREQSKTLLDGLLDDSCPAVATTALVSSFQVPGADTEALQRRVSRLVLAADCETLCALANAVGRAGAEELRWVLDELLQSRDLKVQAAAARALAEVPAKESLPRLLPLLQRAITRSPARDAITALGGDALPALAEYLDDESLPRRVRRHLPRTILRFQSQAALDVLSNRLLRDRDGAVRFKILRGMGRLIADNPGYTVDRTMLEGVVHAHLERILRFEEWSVCLLASAKSSPRLLLTTGHELLLASLREKRVNALERVFRVLHMLKPGEGYELYWRGLNNNSPRGRAASLELLDHALPAAFRETILALIDDVDPSERITRAAASLGLTRLQLAHTDVIAQLRQDQSGMLKAIAEYHTAELAEERTEVDGRDGVSLADIAERSMASFQELDTSHA
jgi:AAA family ATP:ADP antiporter